jgi:hypothetical protein
MNIKANTLFGLTFGLLSVALPICSQLPAVCQTPSPAQPTANQTKSAVTKSATAKAAAAKVAQPGTGKSKTIQAAATKPQSTQPSEKETKASRRDGAMRFNAKNPESKELWYRYMYYGSQAHAKGDDKTAKRYLYGALAEIESKRPFKVFGPELAGLQRQLKHVYPRDWSKENDMDLETKLKLQQEEAAMLSRIYRLDASLGESGQIPAKVEQSHYNNTEKEIKKTEEAIAQAHKDQSAATTDSVSK